MAFSASIYGISETVSVYLTESDPVYVNIKNYNWRRNG